MPKASTISFASLPTLGADLEGGTFEGLTTKPDGTHWVVVKLPEYGANLTHKQAMAWAKKLGGELPTKAIAALITSNTKVEPGWYWTSETYSASSAWYFSSYGYSIDTYRRAEGGALAVRLIPLTA